MHLPNPPEDADLYRFDGRFYEINEEKGVLRLELRRSVIWERVCVCGLLFSALFALAISYNWSIYLYWPDLYRSSEASFLVGLLANTPFFIATNVLSPLLMKDTWKFERYNGRLRYRRNRDMTIPVPEVRLLKAWQRGFLFYLSLELAQGKALQLGRWGFSRSEYAWRQDAAQIADFLGVPLDIPPP
jgi:hypothetical protein